MNIFLNRGGSCQKVVPERIYQGSANVNEIVVVAPFDNNTALAIAFRLPDGTKTEYLPMAYAATQPDASGKVYFWTYKLPLAITEIAGEVSVVINAVSATNNQTSYSCTFTVEASIVPDEPAAPSLSAWNDLLTLYAQNAAAIAAFADGRVPIGNIAVTTLAAGEQATVEVEWNAESSALDFTYGIPQGLKGDTGSAGAQIQLQVTATHIQWKYTDSAEWTNLIALGDLQGCDMTFAGEWNAATEYKNNATTIDTVTLNGALWICAATNTNSQPAVGNTNWKLAAKGIASVTATTGGLAVTYTDGTTTTIAADLLTVTELGFDAAPTEDSENLVTSGGVYGFVSENSMKPGDNAVLVTTAFEDLDDYVVPSDGYFIAQMVVPSTDTNQWTCKIRHRTSRGYSIVDYDYKLSPDTSLSIQIAVRMGQKILVSSSAFANVTFYFVASQG